MIHNLILLFVYVALSSTRTIRPTPSDIQKLFSSHGTPRPKIANDYTTDCQKTCNDEAADWYEDYYDAYCTASCKTQIVAVCKDICSSGECNLTYNNLSFSFESHSECKDTCKDFYIEIARDTDDGFCNALCNSICPGGLSTTTIVLIAVGASVAVIALIIILCCILHPRCFCYHCDCQKNGGDDYSRMKN